MAITDFSAVSAVVGYEPGSYNSNGTDNGADITVPKGADHVMVVVNAGTHASSSTHNVHIEQSSAGGGSGYTDITGAAFTEIDSSNDDAVYVGLIRLAGNEGFIRTVVVHGGTGAAQIGISLIFGTYSQSEDAGDWAFNVSA